MAFVRSDCSVLDTAGSTTHPLQTKVKPISQVDSASGNILKRQNVTWQGGSEKPQYQKGQRRRCSRCQSRDWSVACQRDHGGAGSWRGRHSRAVGYFLKESGAQCSRFFWKIAAHGKDPCWTRGRSEEALAAGQGQPTTPAKRKAETFSICRFQAPFSHFS